MSNWREYWSRPVGLLVNARHREVHYARVADDLIAELPSSPGTILDYGCGEALEAWRVADRSRHLYLCDASSQIRADLATRLGGRADVTVLAPEDIDTLTDGTLDLVVANSVVQYLSVDECRALFGLLHRKLARSGRLIVADVIPPDAGFLADIAALLGTALRHRFLFAALFGLAATLNSDYPKLRRAVGLSTWSEAAFVDLLVASGYAVARRPRNFGFNRRRMTFIASPRP